MADLPLSTGTLRIRKLAKDFIRATVDKAGTDEDRACKIVKEVHDLGGRLSFEVTLYELVDPSTQNKLLAKHPGALLNAIFKDEFSGSELAKVEDLYFSGIETYRADQSDYLLEGASDTFDLSTTSSKVLLGGLTMGLIGLGIVFPAAAILISGAMVLTATGAGAASAGYYGVKYLSAENAAEKKSALRGIGQGGTVAVSSAIFLPSAINNIRNIATGLLATFRAMAALETIDTAAVSKMNAARSLSALESSQLQAGVAVQTYKISCLKALGFRSLPALIRRTLVSKQYGGLVEFPESQLEFFQFLKRNNFALFVLVRLENGLQELRLSAVVGNHDMMILSTEKVIAAGACQLEPSGRLMIAGFTGEYITSLYGIHPTPRGTHPADGDGGLRAFVDYLNNMDSGGFYWK